MLILAALLLASVEAEASCIRVFGLFCDAPYVVAEIIDLETDRTRLTVRSSHGEGAEPVGSELTLNTLPTDRRGNLIVVSQGFRMGELIDDRFEHFGASLSLEQVESLRADPLTCEAELEKLGGEPPDCDDTAGCASAAASGWSLVAMWLVMRRYGTRWTLRS